MTSYVKTTAVSIRKGSREANNGFTGVLGEITADLGDPDPITQELYGTDINTTIRLHNGITMGGIRMARADTRNITTSVLAENREMFYDKNLAYADLSNLEKLNMVDQAPAVTNVVKTLTDYGLANKDMSNVNTVDLAAGEGVEGKHKGKNLAYANMSNVNTVDLATGSGQYGKHQGNDLAYADTSNINTANLVDSVKHDGTASKGKPLAYADASNINTTQLATEREGYGEPLAYADLSNALDALNNQLDNVKKVETIINKDDIIPDNDSDVAINHYPMTSAVKTYVDNKISGLDADYMETNFSNAKTWELLYATGSNESLYGYSYELETTGIFEVGDVLTTDVLLTNDKRYIAFFIDTSNGFNVEFEDDYTAINLNSYSPLVIESENKDSTITIHFTSTNISPGIYLNRIDHFTVNGHASDFAENVRYSPINDIVIYNPFLHLKVDAVDNAGKVTKLVLDPEEGYTNLTNAHVSIEDGTETLECTVSSILLTPEIGGAGLLKTDMTNLIGMSESETITEQNSPWSISHLKAIPAITEGVDESEYYRIVTSGLVWDALFRLLTAIFPVGSGYKGIGMTCPLEALIPDSRWELVEDEVNVIETESGHSLYLNTWVRVE